MTPFWGPGPLAGGPNPLIIYGRIEKRGSWDPKSLRYIKGFGIQTPLERVLGQNGPKRAQNRSAFSAKNRHWIWALFVLYLDPFLTPFWRPSPGPYGLSCRILRKGAKSGVPKRAKKGVFGVSPKRVILTHFGWFWDPKSLNVSKGIRGSGGPQKGGFWTLPGGPFPVHY